MMSNSEVDPRLSRTVMVPFPSIYHAQGDRTYPYRCPACSSDDYFGAHIFVDERRTWALNPAIFDKSISQPLAFQRYIVLTCRNCRYSYHLRPEGLWYSEKHPLMSVGTFVSEASRSCSSDQAEEADETSRVYVGKISYPPAFKARLEELSAEFPIYRMPEPHAIVQVRSGQPAMRIARFQDFRILDLARKKRYSDSPVNNRITGQPIALLIGAGFSASLGFPTAGDFKSRLSPDVVQALEVWLSEKPELLNACLQDFEILLDVLLSLQTVAVMYDRTEDFIARVNDAEPVSPFAFREVFPEGRSDRANWAGYAPLTHVQPRPEFRANGATEHFRRVRKVLLAAVRAILQSCSFPSSQRLNEVKDDYRDFLIELSSISEGPVPVYSTNYDLALEAVLKGDQVLADGVGAEVDTPLTLNIPGPSGLVAQLRIPWRMREVTADSYLNIDDRGVILFRLHGACNWVLNRQTGQALSLSTRSQEDVTNAFEAFWRSRSEWIPGIVAPATVKDAYTITPPFCIGYDYLAEQLKRCKILVMIGQRLRDETLKEMIHWSGSANPELKFVLVDLPEDSSRLRHIVDCVPRGRLTYIGGGFPQASKHITAACISLLAGAR
jgi:hypothetical protein